MHTRQPERSAVTPIGTSNTRALPSQWPGRRLFSFAANSKIVGELARAHSLCAATCLLTRWRLKGESPDTDRSPAWLILVSSSLYNRDVGGGRQCASDNMFSSREDQDQTSLFLVRRTENFSGGIVTLHEIAVSNRLFGCLGRKL